MDSQNSKGGNGRVVGVVSFSMRRVWRARERRRDGGVSRSAWQGRVAGATRGVCGSALLSDFAVGAGLGGGHLFVVLSHVVCMVGSSVARWQRWQARGRLTRGTRGAGGFLLHIWLRPSANRASNSRHTCGYCQTPQTKTKLQLYSPTSGLEAKGLRTGRLHEAVQQT